MNRVFTAMIVLCMITGNMACSTLKKIERNDLVEAGSNRTDVLNGKYKDRTVKQNRYTPESLWSELDYRKNNKDSIPATAIVQIEADGAKKLNCTLWNDGSVIKNITLKGKYKGGYFSAKRYYKTIPIPFIYYFIDEHKIRIGKTLDGSLVIDGLESHSGWILIMAGGSMHKYDLRCSAVH